MDRIDESPLLSETEASKRPELELEDLALKIKLNENDKDSETGKFLTSIFPKFEITDKLEDADVYMS